MRMHGDGRFTSVTNATNESAHIWVVDAADTHEPRVAHLELRDGGRTVVADARVVGENLCIAVSAFRDRSREGGARAGFGCVPLEPLFRQGSEVQLAPGN